MNGNAQDPRIKAALDKTHYAHAVLEVKAVDTERRVFTGMATTPTPDRVDDVIEPHGAKFKNPLTLLLHHAHQLPVGTAKLGKATDDGIPFEATIPDIKEDGKLKERVDEAWHSVKYRVIRGVSIGFRAMEDGIELLRTGGLRFTKIEILELSLVSVPANAEAVISTIKSIDAPYIADTGTGAGSIAARSSAVVDPNKTKALKGAISMKPVAEQITGFEATRQAKSARMSELMSKAAETGVTLDDQQSEEYDGLDADVKAIDQHLTRLRALEETNKNAATPVNGSTVKDANASRAGVTASDPKLPPGIAFARYAMAKVRSYKEHRPVLEIVKEMWPSHTGLHEFVVKAAVPAGTTTDPTWASPLVNTNNAAQEFVEFVRPQTIIGKLDFVTVPFNIPIVAQTGGGTAYWVGQGAPKPLTSFGFSRTTMSPTKVAAISVITEELARFSNPSAETLVRNGLAGAVIERVDIDLIDPASAAVTNVQPASLTNGLTALTSAGTSADNVRTDLMRLLSQFVAANARGARIALIMPDTLALGLSLMTNALGQPEFPNIGQEGGNLRGIKVVTSQYAANASGFGNLVIAVNQAEVFLADDGQVTIDASREASLQMLDNPTNNSATATPTTMVSMFQTNSIALRAERFINWQKRRAEAVAYIDDANWGSVGSPA